MKNQEEEASNDQVSETKTVAKKREPLYYIFKDANGSPMKIANMNNRLICKRQGVVEIECIRKKNTVEPDFGISRVDDRESGIIYGVNPTIDARTKDVRFKRFRVGDFATYDLSKYDDAVEWAIVSRAPWLLGSAFQRGKVYYKMHDKDAEARDVIAKSSIRSKATEIAHTQIPIEDMMDMYRCFGKNPAGFSPLRLQAELVKIAENTPKEFYDLWTSSNRKLLMTFNRCVSIGLITMDIQRGGFMWKNSLALGLTEQSAMEYLVKNPQLLNQADIESQKQDVGKKAFIGLSKAEKDFFEVEEFQEEDVELVELRQSARLMGVADYQTLGKEELEKIVDEIDF